MKKSNLEKELKKKHFRVTIFGSARIKKDDKTYEQISSLAQMIAKENIDVITGGGPGLMEAATHGHKQGRKGRKIHTLGLRIRLPFEQKKEKHLDVIKDFDRFSERLDTFMALSNAVVVAPGGVGTLLEFFYTWQLTQVKHICDIPIILLGDMWEELLFWIKKYPMKRKLINQSDLDNIFIVKTNKEVMKIIKKLHTNYKKGTKNVCINIKKYELQ